MDAVRAFHPAPSLAATGGTSEGLSGHEAAGAWDLAES